MNFIDILKVLVMGIVEGFTEWLPISSTGHMILVDDFLQLNFRPEFKEMFLMMIQSGAMLAIVVLYFRRLNPFSPRKSSEQKKATWRLWAKIAVACIPAAIVGLLADDWIQEHMFNGFIVAVSLIVYGILFIVVENVNRYKEPYITRLGQMDYMTAFYIGLFQVLALIPGTIRLGATILGAMLLGCSRGVSTEFSFFLGIPVIFGTSFIKMLKFGFDFQGYEIFYLVIGMLTAFFVSIYAVKFLLNWIKKNDFKFFGYYRIVLGVIVLIWYGVSMLLK